MRYYLDTSVFGGYYDKEFKEHTRQFFKEIELGLHEIIVSNITIDELEPARKEIKDLIQKIPKNNIEFVSDQEAKQLANFYVSEEVITEKFYFDALHVALASINRVDVLISWNLKHMVNLNRIRQYNAVNLKYGFPTIDIRTPKEVINEK